MTCDPFPLLPTPNASVAQDGEKPDTWLARREEAQGEGLQRQRGGDAADDRRPTAASLCSGIGGLDLAVSAALGCEPAWFCESDPHCARVLERHFPGVPVLPDVREIDAGLPAVAVLHAGYPCQPFSFAGKRQGENDPRHLWPAVRDAIRVLGPRVVVLENVAGHLRLGFDTVLADLADLGMAARWGVVRAADVGAPHRRARLFAYADRQGSQGPEPAERRDVSAGRGGAATDTGSERHDRRRRPDERGAAGERGGRAGAPGHRAPAGDAAERRDTQQQDVGSSVGSAPEPTGAVAWGVYEPAIRRWEHALGRPAPRPTDDRGRLMPAFVEWMMGFPEGWVDGTKRTHALRMLGNAVVPQQGALALRLLLEARAA